MNPGLFFLEVSNIESSRITTIQLSRSMSVQTQSRSKSCNNEFNGIADDLNALVQSIEI